jgi:hypothetical protein
LAKVRTIDAILIQDMALATVVSMKQGHASQYIDHHIAATRARAGAEPSEFTGRANRGLSVDASTARAALRPTGCSCSAFRDRDAFSFPFGEPCRARFQHELACAAISRPPPNCRRVPARHGGFRPLHEDHVEASNDATSRGSTRWPG